MNADRTSFVVRLALSFGIVFAAAQFLLSNAAVLSNTNLMALTFQDLVIHPQVLFFRFVAGVVAGTMGWLLWHTVRGPQS